VVELMAGRRAPPDDSCSIDEAQLERQDAGPASGRWFPAGSRPHRRRRRNHSRFGWDDLVISGVIEPLRRGGAVAGRRPGMRTAVLDRSGRADAGLVVVEGAVRAVPRWRHTSLL
jgi:hypothetical protein